MAIDVVCDIRHRFGPARDQGMRPTCLAFAVSDAHAALREPWAALSCEFAFYHAQRRAGRPPTVAARLPEMLATLKEDGQPFEGDWPYLASLPSDLDAYRPPKKMVVFRRNGKSRPVGVDEIIGLLDDGSPTVMLMMLSDAFYMPDVSLRNLYCRGERLNRTRAGAPFSAIGSCRVPPRCSPVSDAGWFCRAGPAWCNGSCTSWIIRAAVKIAKMP